MHIEGLPDFQHELEIMAETTEGIEKLLNPKTKIRAQAVMFCLEHLREKMQAQPRGMPSLTPVLYSGLAASVLVVVMGLFGFVLPMSEVEYGGATALLLLLHYAAGRILLGTFPTFNGYVWFGVVACLGGLIAAIVLLPAVRGPLTAATVTGVGGLHLALCWAVLRQKDYNTRARIVFAASHAHNRFHLNALVLSANQSADLIEDLLQQEDSETRIARVATKLRNSFANHDPLGFSKCDLEKDLGSLLRKA